MARLVFVVLLLIAAPAAAQSGGADVVHLLDGGIVRGTIVEHLPGEIHWLVSAFRNDHIDMIAEPLVRF